MKQVPPKPCRNFEKKNLLYHADIVKNLIDENVLS